jgi:hypothetical protein
MTAAQLSQSPYAAQEPQSAMDEAEGLTAVVGAIFQAGPPAYAIVAIGGVVALLACAPLMILAAVVAISLAVTAIVAGLAAAVVVVAVRLVRALREQRQLPALALRRRSAGSYPVATGSDAAHWTHRRASKGTGAR